MKHEGERFTVSQSPTLDAVSVMKEAIPSEWAMAELYRPLFVLLTLY
jgi:hypothetical protein